MHSVSSMIIAHPETALQLSELGSTYPQFNPTYRTSFSSADRFHQRLSRLPLKDGVLIQLRDRRFCGAVIPGFLRREDALKLYELARFSPGDILEIGCGWGLSTSIIARARRGAPSAVNFLSIDCNPSAIKATALVLRRGGLATGVVLRQADALTEIDLLIAAGHRFSFVFIDHDHSREALQAVCQKLPQLMRPGGFCLFHDYNDARNRDDLNSEYGVYQGVQEGLDPANFEFYGIYGCCGLFREFAAANEIY